MEDNIFRDYYTLYGDRTTPYAGEIEGYAMPQNQILGGAFGHTQFNPYGGYLNLAGGADYSLLNKTLAPYAGSSLVLPSGLEMSGLLQKLPDDILKEATVRTPDAYLTARDSNAGKEYEAGIQQQLLGGLLDIFARKDDYGKGIYGTYTLDF